MEIETATAVYSRGHLLFTRGQVLMAQPFDPEALTLAGSAFPVADAVDAHPTAVPLGLFSASASGTLVYQPAAGVAGTELAWMDRSGRRIGTLGDRAAYGDLEFSPDRRRLAVSVVLPGRSDADIWLYDVERGVRTRFTFDAAMETAPVWSSDGSRVALSSGGSLVERPATGAGNASPLVAEQGLGNKLPLSWSRDYVLFGAVVAGQQMDLWAIALTTGDRKPFPVLETPFVEQMGRLSPDGRWLAYVSNESGRDALYVTSFPRPEGKWQVSTGGAAVSWPRWRQDGAEIYWLEANVLMAATVSGRDEAFEVREVRRLFQVTTRVGGRRSPYDATADGQRFLFNGAAGEDAAAAPLTVVVNWAGGR